MSKFHIPKVFYFVATPPMKKIVQLALEDFPLNLYEGTSWEEAEQFLTLSNFDLVILDATLLNEGSSESFLTKATTVPLLLLEGAGTPRRRIAEGGRSEVLRRPFAKEDFLAAIQNLGLHWKREKPSAPQVGAEELETLELGMSLKEQLKLQVKLYVETYCQEHFSALAEKVLTREIRRLTDERASLLDND